MAAAERVFGLDLLRAVAILVVVYGHGMHFISPDLPANLLAIPVLDGVTLFFVLSGYLIGRILLKTISHEQFSGSMLLQFWIRRWFRTLPNYYFVLTLTIVATLVTGDRTPPMPEHVFSYYLFFQNLAWPHPEFFGEAWSLAIEEWFYLAIPIPLLLISKTRKIDLHRFMWFYIFAVILGTTLLRIYLVMTQGYDNKVDWDYNLKMQVVTRMDSLMFGVLGAYLSLYHKDTWTRANHPLIFWSGVALLIIDRFMRLDGDNMAYLNYFALTLTPIATLMLLPKLSMWHTLPGPVGKTVTFISVVSYSMYLLNQALIAETLIPALMPSLMHLLWRFGDHIHLIQYTLFWFLTIASSAALYRFYEKPMTHLRERFGKGHHTPAHAFKHPT
jgi:peptidoglycan/LPS O-acetylase OafA/YrhL